MTYRFRILPAAQADAFSTEDRLEGECPGSGTAFGRLMADAVADISARARSFSPAEDGPAGVEAREVYIARFRQRVIFVVDGNEAVVVAVVHAHRRPGGWTDRLSELD